MMPTRFVKKSITSSGHDFVYNLSSAGFFNNGLEWAIYYDSSWKLQGIKHPNVYTVAIGSTDMLFGMYEQALANKQVEFIANRIENGEIVRFSKEDVWL
jgi:hypothetical protein